METEIISNSQISSNGVDKDQARLYIGTGTWKERKLWVNVTLNGFYNITGISIQGARFSNEKSKYYVKSYYVYLCFQNPCERQERIGKVWIFFFNFVSICLFCCCCCCCWFCLFFCLVGYHSFILVCIESCKLENIDKLYMQSQTVVVFALNIKSSSLAKLFANTIACIPSKFVKK